VSGLSTRHFELYRLMWACSAPGQAGRPVCSYGQAKLAARLGVSVPTVQRLIADMREPGADVRHPGVKPSGLRLGWLQVLPRELAGGRGGTLYGGNRYVLQLDPGQVDQLEASHLASGHMPRSQRSITPGEPVSPGQIEASGDSVMLRRYVRSNPPTGGALTHPESEPAGSALQQQPITNNANGKPEWLPPEVYRPLKAAQIAANPREGLAKAEAYLAKCEANDQRRERMRVAGQQAQAVQAAEHPDGAELATGGYGKWLPAWAVGGPPALPAPRPPVVEGTSRLVDREQST
jgi:hypothetical protein